MASQSLKRGPNHSLADLVLGAPLASSEDKRERIGPPRGVRIFGLDALASAAYGPEAALTVLMPLGAIATAATTAIVLVAKFSSGAWVVFFRFGSDW